MTTSGTRALDAIELRRRLCTGYEHVAEGLVGSIHFHRGRVLGVHHFARDLR